MRMKGNSLSTQSLAAIAVLPVAADPSNRTDSSGVLSDVLEMIMEIALKYYNRLSWDKVSNNDQ